MVDTSDGALKLCLTEPVNGYNISYVAADEDTISMLVTDRVSFADMCLVNYDISKKTVTNNLDLGKEFFNKISRFDNRIIICSSDRVVIYDNKLEYINGFGVSSCPEDLLKIDDRLMVRNMYGELYSAESETAGMQMTEHYFGDKGGTEASLFEYKEGAFYIFSKGMEGIIVYTMADGSAYQQIDALSDEEMDEQTDWEAYNCRDVFETLEGFDIDMYDFGRRSSDRKYYIVSLLDGSTHFYDAESLEEIKTYYTFGGYINQFFYLEKYDCYCVTDDSLRIFNPEMEYLAAVDNIWYAWEDKTDGELCVMRDYGQCYKLKLMLYSDIMKYVDELLEGYTPSGRIKEKYGL